MPVSSSMAAGSKVGGGGGSKADILLVISLVAKGIGEAEKVRKELKGLSGETKSTSDAASGAATGVDKFFGALKGVANVATGVVGAVSAVAASLQTVLDVGQSGAAYSQMQESFQSLNNTVAPGIDLLDQLGEASLGTASKFELMNAASVALAGLTGEFGQEMADALPRLLEIAKASEKMNPALGDTGFLFQSLTIGLKRLSPRLIDNTGLQIRLSEAYEKLAKQRGKSTQELTAEEQQLALLNATLEAGQVLIQQAGGSVESMTDAYTRFGAKTENLKNSLKAMFDELIGRRVVTGLEAIMFGIQGINEHYAEIVKSAGEAATATRDLGAEYDAYIEKVVMIGHATGEITDAQRDLILEFLSADEASEGYDKLSEKFGRLIQNLGLMTEETYRLNNAMTEADRITAYENYQESVLQAATGSRKLSTNTAELIREFNRVGSVSDSLIIKYGQQVVNMSNMGKLMPIREAGDFEKALIELMHSLDMITQSEYEALMAGKALEDGVANEALKFGLYTGSIKEAKEATEEETASQLTLTEAMKLAKTDAEKVRIATELFSVALDENAMAAYRTEEATLLNNLAVGEYTESEREAIETELALVRAKISAGEASQDLAEEEQELAEETKKLADEARNAKTAFQEMFEGLDIGYESDIAGFKDDIEFIKAGGADAQKEWELVELLTQRQLIPLDNAISLSDKLYAKALQIGVASKDMTLNEAATKMVSELSLNYDRAAASAYALEEFEKLKNDAIEDGLDLTEERLRKLEDEANMTGALRAEYDEAYRILKEASDLDFLGELTEALDPSIFTQSFASLPDDLQQLFLTALGGMEGAFEVDIKPTMSEDSARYLEDMGIDEEIPMDAVLSVTADYADEKELLDWILSGATQEQKVAIAANFTEDLTPEMKVLLEGEDTAKNVNVAVTSTVDDATKELVSSEEITSTISTTVTDDASEHVKKLALNETLASAIHISVTDDTRELVQKLVMNDDLSNDITVNVSDDIQSDLATLLLNQTLERTVRVTVVTEGEVPGKAVGGRIQRGEVYTVGEVRPELFVSDTAGRVMMNGNNPYGYGNTTVSAPVYVNINNPSISSDLDLEILSYQIARKISERQRGVM